MVEVQADPPDEVEASRMTLGEHLEELRTRLIRSTLAIVIAFAVCWIYRVDLNDIVQRPYEQASDELNARLVVIADEKIEASDDPLEWKEWYEPGYVKDDPETKRIISDKRIPKTMKGDFAASGFFFYMKMCFYFALFFGGPILLWQMWAFIAAGLYRHEKSVIHHYFPFSVALFFAGVLFGYFVMIPNALYFLALQTLGEILWYESITSYWTFMVALTLALGLIFQLPIVMLGISKMGLVNPKTFGKYRPHMIVGSLIASALLTPPDPFTQMMMAVPIAVLYETGHIISRVFVRTPTTPQRAKGK